MKDKEKLYGVFTVSDTVNGNVQANRISTGLYFKTRKEAEAAADNMFYEDMKKLPNGNTLGYSIMVDRVV